MLVKVKKYKERSRTGKDICKNVSLLLSKLVNVHVEM